MYTLKFSLDFFSGNQAWTRQSFQKIGQTVRVKELTDERFVGQLDERRWFLAKSRKLFAIAIVSRAGGQNAHLDGQITFLVAEGCRFSGENLPKADGSFGGQVSAKVLSLFD
ncbi:MAG: hypothetical protein AAB871_00455 [Patescibacteria group bacterium]